MSDTTKIPTREEIAKLRAEWEGVWPVGPDRHVPYDEILDGQAGLLAAAEMAHDLAEALESLLGPVDQIEAFEVKAADFWHETGLWPPGKDAPAAMGDVGYHLEEWKTWQRERHNRHVEKARGALARYRATCAVPEEVGG